MGGDHGGSGRAAARIRAASLAAVTCLPFRLDSLRSTRYPQQGCRQVRLLFSDSKVSFSWLFERHLFYSLASSCSDPRLFQRCSFLAVSSSNLTPFPGIGAYLGVLLLRSPWDSSWLGFADSILFHSSVKRCKGQRRRGRGERRIRETGFRPFRESTSRLTAIINSCTLNIGRDTPVVDRHPLDDRISAIGCRPASHAHIQFQ